MITKHFDKVKFKIYDRQI